MKLLESSILKYQNHAIQAAQVIAETVGLKVMLTLQLAPAANDVMVRLAVPVFLRTTVFAPLVVPIGKRESGRRQSHNRR
jgi:hypothetical protein